MPILQLTVEYFNLYKERYGRNPGFGNEYWFKSQILSELEAGGISRSDILNCMGYYTNDIKILKSVLLENRADKAALIDKVFKKYGR